jgi:hypothetical protein
MKPTRATLVSDPYRTVKTIAASSDWRAGALIDGMRETLVIGQNDGGLHKGAAERYGPDEAIRIESRRSAEWERCMAAARTAA